MKKIWMVFAFLLICALAFSSCEGIGLAGLGEEEQGAADETKDEIKDETKDETKDEIEGDATDDGITESHTHLFGEWAVVEEPSCTDTGVEERSCSCGEKETATISALGHTEEIDPAVAPTCTAEGKTEGKHCSLCKEVLVEQTTLDKVAHTFVNAICSTCRKTDTVGPKLKSVSLPDQSGVLTVGDVLIVDFTIVEDSDIKICQTGFKNEATGASIYIGSYLTHNADGKYILTYEIPETMSPGKWVYNGTLLMDEWGIFGDDEVFDSGVDIFFYVEGDNTDVSGPLLRYASIEQQGKTLKVGDKLTILLEIVEQSDIRICQTGFKNEATGASIYIDRYLTHNADGKYVLTYEIPETMSPGKWVYNGTLLMDERGLSGDDEVIGSGVDIFFYVEGDNTDVSGPLLRHASIEQQGKTLKVGDKLTIRLEIVEDSDIRICQIGFKNEATGASIYIDRYLTHSADGKYVLTYEIPETMGSGKWVYNGTLLMDAWGISGDDEVFGSGVDIFFYV